MEEVQIEISRATRFVNNLVKAVAFLSFLLFLLSFYIYKFKAGGIYQKQVKLCDVVWSQGMTETNPLDNPIQSAFLDVKANCIKNATHTVNLWGETAFIALDISILLPLVYFGSKKLVKDTTDKYIKKQTLTPSA